jgi:hypothetical protein
MERNVSIDRCRKLLGPKLSGSDQDLAMLREQFYSLADLFLDVRADEKNSRQVGTERLERAANSKEELEVLQERAAIIEFEGDVSREDAEQMAISFALENERLN